MRSDKQVDVVAVGSWSLFDHIFRVRQLPQPGDTVRISSPTGDVETVYWGGCAQNNAAAAARLGASTALISVVGQDFHDRSYDAYLAELGIDLNSMIIVDDEKSGHSFIFSDPNGDAICLSTVGVAARQDEFKPDKDMLSSARVVTINYRFDLFTLQAAQTAREAGGRVIISGPLTTSPEFSRRFIDAAHILVCSKHELQSLVKSLALSERRGLFEQGIQAMVVTLGSEGSLLLTPGSEIHIPALPARETADPVGAGDGLVGGLATGLAFGHSLTHAAWLGSAVASYVVEAVGCQTNLPTLRQAMRRVSNHFGPGSVRNSV